MMKVSAVIERGTGGEFPYSVFVDCDELEYGLSGTGRTAAEAMDDFLAAYREIESIYKTEGRKFTEVKFEFIYDLPSFLRFYEYAFTLAGLERITGVNQRQLSHYINGTSRPSSKTVLKIESSIRNFGKQLSEINLVVAR